MNISIGADHGGYALRERLILQLESAGHTILDHGTQTPESVDYPDYARLVAEDLRAGRAERGVLICTTGIGMSMAANKFPGVRAALIHFPDDARFSRLHNDANVIVFSGRHHTPYEAASYLDIFLETPFEAGGRHERRLCKFHESPSPTV